MQKAKEMHSLLLFPISRAILSFLLLAFFGTTSISGTILVTPSRVIDSCSENTIDFSGEIRIGDASQLVRIIESLKKKYGDKECTNGSLSIRFFSDGGDVSEAIKIGKVLRDNKLRGIVPLNSKCSSACVLAYAGTIKKDTLGAIGVHRPYFSKLDSSASINEIKIEREKITKSITNYFNQIDIPVSLVDLMLSVPPEKIKVLTPDELLLYRLEGVDANYDESEVAISAKLYGLTSVEYRRKNAEVSSQCKNAGHLYFDCYNTKMLNISAAELNRRLDLAERYCSKSASEECYRKYLFNK